MENLTIALPTPLWQTLTKVSGEEEKTLNQLIQEAIQKYLTLRQWQTQGSLAALRLHEQVSRQAQLDEAEAEALAVTETRAYREGR